MVKTRLRELRNERALTLAQVADAVGVNYRTISQYELGVNEPDIETIKQLCAFFGVSADYFLRMEDE